MSCYCEHYNALKNLKTDTRSRAACRASLQSMSVSTSTNSRYFPASNSTSTSTLSYEDIQYIVSHITKGGVGVLPTDSSYAFVCDVQNVEALSRMYRIKKVKDPTKGMSLLCRHMRDIDTYTQGFTTNSSNNVNWFRIVKKYCIPGPYTFLLPASKSLPKQCLEFDKCRIRRQVGVRMPHDRILQQILDSLDRPLFCSSVPELQKDTDDETYQTNTGFRIYQRYSYDVDFVVDDGIRDKVSTILDLTDVNNSAKVIRLGAGCVSAFEEHVTYDKNDKGDLRSDEDGEETLLSEKKQRRRRKKR